jgi:hypothetical protein
VCDS